MRRALLLVLLASSAHAAQRLAEPPCKDLPRVTVSVQPFALSNQAPEDETSAALTISGKIEQPPNCTTIGATFQGYEGANAPGVSGPLPVAQDGSFSTIVNVPTPQDGAPITLRVQAVIVNEAGTGRSAPVEVEIP